jgi:hypothetical protein
LVAVTTISSNPPDPDAVVDCGALAVLPEVV